MCTTMHPDLKRVYTSTLARTHLSRTSIALHLAFPSLLMARLPPSANVIVSLHFRPYPIPTLPFRPHRRTIWIHAPAGATGK